MTAPLPPVESVETIAGKLTKAQRAMILASQPGGWGIPETSTGADVIGAGLYAVARALESKGLGDLETSPGSYPPRLYFNNRVGLSVRLLLQRNSNNGK